MSGEIDMAGLEDETDPIETWLQTEVVAAYDELRADSSQAISSDEIRAQLAELQKQGAVEQGSCPAAFGTRAQDRAQ